MENQKNESQAKVFSLNVFQSLKDQKVEAYVYRVELAKMNKTQLLQELVLNHDAYLKNPKDTQVTFKGQQLLEVLNEKVELQEMKDMVGMLKRKLENRLRQQIQVLQDSKESK